MLKKNLFIGIALVVVAIAGFFGIETWREMADAKAESSIVEPIDEEEPSIKYGINLNDFKVLNHVVGKNELFADILSQYNVAFQTIHLLANASNDIFNLRKIKAGSSFTILCGKKDSGIVPKKLIYEENEVDYVVFNLDDSLHIYRGQNDVEHKHREVSGIIHSSLYVTLQENDIDPVLAIRMSEIFAWSVDFYKIQNGDKFKIIYDEDVVDGKSVSIGEISAVLFNSGNKDIYSFYFDKDGNGKGSYFDEKGNSMKKQFLKSPVKFSRISSHFTRKRFHPVTKVWKAHLGTDYAAPHGTPILATADGVVEEARFKVFNGNYVKIRHNGEYKTQYLHMSKIGKSIRKGTRVKQGDVIGYVGSTGLATGPHVCYRFWKDGKQVDPRNQKTGFADPLPEKYKTTFLARTQTTKESLDAISYEEHNIGNQKKEIAAVADSSQSLVRRFF